MTLQEKHDLTEVINARGTYTPLGVSRSSESVCKAVSEALSSYFLIDELHNLVCKSISDFAGSEAAAVFHCTASAITVAIAATMTGTHEDRVAELPHTGKMANCVVVPASHCINYGHAILQAVRMSGAKPVVTDGNDYDVVKNIEQCIIENNTCCLLLVSSKLVEGELLNFEEAVKIAHKHGLPVIIDGAAQDLRINELIETKADLVLVSAQKYLGGPTAGLIMGREDMIKAVRAQEKGIGRGMKTTKEALIGVLTAIQQRENLNLEEWKEAQYNKSKIFIQRANSINGVNARCESDPTGLPFSRVVLNVDAEICSSNAMKVARDFKSGKPAIWVIDKNAKIGELGFELVQVNQIEIDVILEKLMALLA